MNEQPPKSPLVDTKVQIACDDCTQGVMDQDNPHLHGLCQCPCHSPHDAADVGCPHCEVLPGVACMTPDGVMAGFHKARIRRAYEVHRG